MKVKSLQEKLRFLLFRMLPIQKGTVLFKSFSGQYGDNPKYVSERLHEVRPDLTQVWVTSAESGGADFPSYVKTVDYNSWAYDYYASTAAAVVDNMSGIRAFRQKDEKAWRRLFLDRKGQLNLCTWHGTPLKQIGIHEAPGINVYQTSAHSMSAGNEFCYKVFQECFPGVPIVKDGSPRNDIFFRDIDTEQLKTKLGLPSNKKVLLYAPTFRHNVEQSGVEQLTGIDVERLLKAFATRFGGDWVLVIRLHHEVLVSLRERFGSFVDNVTVFDGNAHDDMGDYLAVSDALWTDYSSSFFDYLLSEKPCFLMSMDREEYIARERGLYLPISDLPFTFSDTPEQFYEAVLHYDETAELARRKAFLEEIGNFEDGHASDRFVEQILNHLGLST